MFWIHLMSLGNNVSKIRQFYKVNCYTLLRHYKIFFNKWFIPTYLDWNKVSSPFVYYQYYNFQDFFIPTYFVFNTSSVKNLIIHRLDNFYEWINYVSLKTLLYVFPTAVKNILVNKKISFDEYLYILTSYGNYSDAYIKFIELYLDKDLTKYKEDSRVLKII